MNTTVILLNTVLFKGTWELRAADYHDIQDGRNPYEEEQDKQHTFRVLK